MTDDQTRAGVDHAPGGARVGEPLRVLIIEDLEDDAVLVVNALRRGGYAPVWQRVQTAAGMKGALKEQPWNLVISDYQLPSFGGPEALMVLQQSEIDLPFIIVSGVVGEDAAVAAMKAGAHDYVMKDNLARLIPAVARELRDAEVRRERKGAEEKLRDSEARTRAIVNTAADGIITVDAHGTIESFNPAAERVFGYRAPEVVGRNVGMVMPSADATHPDGQRAGFLGARRQAAAATSREILGRRKDGTEFPMEIAMSEFQYSGHRMFTGIVRDVSERKRTEEELVHLAAIVQSSEDAIVGRTLDGAIVTWNEGAERIYGYSAAEVLGQPMSKLWPPDLADEEEQIQQRISRGYRLDHFETERMRRDGSRVPVSLTVSPIKNREGMIIGTSTIARDVTERKEAEAQLRELQELAQQRVRLADIGAIAAEIVHDLGNPLAGLSMQAQLILRRARRDATQPLSTVLRPAEQIVTEMHRLTSLIGEFLNFAREQRLELRKINVSHFLRDVMNLWKPVAMAREIALGLDARSEGVVLMADEEKLRRVLDNLLKNAVEAIEEKPGRITVQVTAPADDAVRISVVDTGTGISDTLRVFRLFETTKRHGSGLGLAVAKQIVEAHGGSITFERRDPHGTTFHVILPRRAWVS